MSVQVAEYPTDEAVQSAVQPMEAYEAAAPQHQQQQPDDGSDHAAPEAHEHDAAAATAEHACEAQPADDAYAAADADAAIHAAVVADGTAFAEAHTHDAVVHMAQAPPPHDRDTDDDAQHTTPCDDAHNNEDGEDDEEDEEDEDEDNAQEQRPLTPNMDEVHEQLAADAAAEEASIEAAKAAVEAQAEEEADLDERRQLCSEIVALRKELAIVKEDEANLRSQLVHTAHIIHTHDPALAEELTQLEEQAAQSQMAHLWHEQCQQHNPDKADWSTININDMPRRVHAAREHFAETTLQAAQLYKQLEVRINEHTDYREEVKARMQQAYNEELTDTAPARARLHQVEDEKRFHAKRGTTRKPASATAVVPEEKRTMSRQRRIDTAEVRTAAEVDKRSNELSDLMAECKLLKQRLDNSRKLHAERQAEMAAALANVRDNGATVRETKERLLKERDELQTLKADLQAVLHYVRAKQREEDAL